MKLEVGDHCYIYSEDQIQRAIIRKDYPEEKMYSLLIDFHEYENIKFQYKCVYSNINDLYDWYISEIETHRRNELDGLLKKTIQAENKWQAAKQKIQKAVYDYKKFIKKY